MSAYRWAANLLLLFRLRLITIVTKRFLLSVKYPGVGIGETSECFSSSRRCPIHFRRIRQNSRRNDFAEISAKIGESGRLFQEWIDRIKLTVLQEFVPVLTQIGMAISVPQFNAAQPSDTPYNLINIADFNSLIAQSQKHNTPVFALSDGQIEQEGVVLETMKKSRDGFQEAFDALARSVEIIVGLVKPAKKTAS